jgi:hypothetical protein
VEGPGNGPASAGSWKDRHPDAPVLTEKALRRRPPLGEVSSDRSFTSQTCRWKRLRPWKRSRNRNPWKDAGRVLTRQRGRSSVQKRQRSNALKEAEQRGRDFGSAPAGRQLQEGNGGAEMHHRLLTGRFFEGCPRCGKGVFEHRASARCVRPPGLVRQMVGVGGSWQRSEPWLARVARHPEPSRGASRRGGEKPRGRNMQQAWQ